MSDTDIDTLFDDKARAAHAAGPVGYDEEGVRQAVRLFLKSIGEDPDREGLLDTPDRIGRACKELFAGLGHGPEEVLKTRFKVDTDEMVLVRDIELFSVCNHLCISVNFHEVIDVMKISVRIVDHLFCSFQYRHSAHLHMKRCCGQKVF